MFKIFPISKRTLATTIMLLAFLGSVFFSMAPAKATPETGRVIAQATTTQEFPGDEQTPGQQAIQPQTPEIDSTEVPPAKCESVGTEMGWLVCPVLESVYGFFDFIAHDIMEDNLLHIDLDISQSTPDAPNPIYDTWHFFLGVANTLFVITLILMIYGMLVEPTGFTQQFSVQRMLPRLVFAVIMAYLSIFFVKFAVDFTNDIGQGISGFILAPVGETADFQFTAAFGSLTDNTVVNTAGSFVDNVVVDLAILYGLGGLAAYLGFASIAFFALMAILVLFLVLIFRVILVTLLLIIAPIAFVAYVLPNTDKYFKLWMSSLWKALLMYPIIMLFITAGRLAARVLTVGNDNILMSIAGIIAAFLPFFILPMTFKYAGAALGSISNMVTNAQAKISGDPRDPTSIRSVLKKKRGQNLERMYTGEKKYFPAPVRAGLKRLPWTDPHAAWVTDVAEARKEADGYKSVGRDYLMLATAQTGGGSYKGMHIRTADGTMKWSAQLKQGNSFIRGANGKPTTNERGQTLIYDGIEARPVTKKDFYSNEVMAEVRKHGSSKAFLTASAEYAMQKAGNSGDYERVIEGIAGSRWTKREKQAIMGGAAATIKGQAMQYKAYKTDHFKGGSLGSVKELPPTPKYDFKKLVAAYANANSWEMSKMDASAWRTMSEEVKIDNLTETQAKMEKEWRNIMDDRLVAIGRRAYQYVDGARTAGYNKYDEKTGEPISLGSQVSPEAAKAASLFYEELWKTMEAKHPGEHGLPKPPRL